MKKRYLLLVACSLCIIVLSCEKDVYRETEYSHYYYPYKGATLTYVKHFVGDSVYADSIWFSFEDTCSSDCIVTISMNGNLISQQKGLSWILPISMSKLKRTGYDTLSFVFTYRGHSNRYNWDYGRGLTRTISINTLKEYKFPFHNCNTIASSLYIDIQNDSGHLSILSDSIISQPYSLSTFLSSYKHEGRDLYDAAGGNQQTLHINWVDDSAIDDVTIWYRDHNIGAVTPHGWVKRYYYDEFPVSGEMELHVRQNDHITIVTIPRYEYIN